MIAGFILGIFCLVIIFLGFIAPRYYDVFVPPSRRHEGLEETVPCELKHTSVGVVATDQDGGESGLVESPSEEKHSSPEVDGKRSVIPGK